MKLALYLSLCSAASAFTLAPLHAASSTALKASATGDIPTNDWTGKPVGERPSTTPVATRKVNKLQRSMMKDVMIDPDYTLVWSIGALGPLIAWYHPGKLNEFDSCLICMPT
jgi:hypothetical protein